MIRYKELQFWLLLLTLSVSDGFLLVAGDVANDLFFLFKHPNE